MLGELPNIVLGEARCPRCGLRVFFSVHGSAAICREMPEWDSRPFEDGILEISPQSAYLEWWKEVTGNAEKGIFRMITPIDPVSPTLVTGAVYITKGSLMGIEGRLIRMTSTTARVAISVEGTERVFDVDRANIVVGKKSSAPDTPTSFEWKTG